MLSHTEVSHTLIRNATMPQKLIRSAPPLYLDNENAVRTRAEQFTTDNAGQGSCLLSLPLYPLHDAWHIGAARDVFVKFTHKSLLINMNFHDTYYNPLCLSK